jgi:predicted dienelactone hydrolase
MIAKFRPAGAPPPQAIPPSAWVHDARIRAAVVAAPALGYTFGKSGLAGVHIPIQLWRAADDHILPQPSYAQAVNDDLASKPEYHVVAGADHMDFLSPCAPDLAQYAPIVCDSATGFDRAAFHANFNRDVVAFLKENVLNSSH